MKLITDCDFSIYSRDVKDNAEPFKCGDQDLDSFFLEDAFLQEGQLLCKSYCFLDHDSQIVSIFTLSNDSIKKIPGSRKRKLEKNIPREKLYSSYPAVMIGRLGVSTSFQNQHIGSQVLDFIKAWFIGPLNKTGCRFLIVDSYNKPENIRFYENNGFLMLFSSEEQEKEYRNYKEGKELLTRLMYFDLIQLTNR